MKTQTECEEIGNKMTLDDFLGLPHPEVYNALKAGYLKSKYVYMLTGYFKKQDIKMEDKLKALKHVLGITGFKCGSGTDEDLIKYINKDLKE